MIISEIFFSPGVTLPGPLLVELSSEACLQANLALLVGLTLS